MKLRVRIGRATLNYDVSPIRGEGICALADCLLQWDDFLECWRVIRIVGDIEDHYRVKGVRGDLKDFTWCELKENVFETCLLIHGDGEGKTNG